MMNIIMTVYLVEERGGDYEDSWSHVIKCFSDIKLAEAFAKSKNEYYNYIESFRKDLIDTHDLFNVLMDKYWFKRPIIDKLNDDYPMEKDNSIFKTCVKETLPKLWEKYTEKEWDNIWEYYMRDDDKVQNGNNKYRNSYLRYFVQSIQVENSL